MTSSSPGDDRRIAREAEYWFGQTHARTPSADTAAFDAWYRQNDAHRRAYDALVADYDRLGMLALTDMGRRRHLPRAAIWQRRPVATATAAGIGVIAIVAGLSLSLRDNPGRDATLSGTIIAADAEAPRRVPLPDGSSVTLAGGGRIANLFSATRRELRLDAGRARFQVAHGDPRPFVVIVASGTIIAHGTVFEVDRGASRVHVRLIQGSISVVHSSPDGRMERRRLSPGQQLDYSADARVEASAGTSDPSARAAMIVFAATRLDEAAAAISAASGRRIVLDPALGALRISGAFQRGDAAGFAAAVTTIFRCRSRSLADGAIALEKSPLGRSEKNGG